MIHTPVSRVGRFTRITTYPSRFRFDITIIIIDGDLDVTSAVPRTTHYNNFIGILLLRIKKFACIFIGHVTRFLNKTISMERLLRKRDCDGHYIVMNLCEF